MRKAVVAAAVTAVALAAGAAVAAGRDDDGGYRWSDGAPTASECARTDVVRKHDGAVIAGLLGAPGEHPIGTPADAYVCYTSIGDVMRLVPDGAAEVAVTPTEVAVPPADKLGLSKVSVTVTSEGAALLRVTLIRDSRTTMDLAVGRVVSDGRTWRFAEVER